MSVSSSEKQKITSEESETAFAAFFRGMDDHILKRLGQDEAAAWWSLSDSEQPSSGEPSSEQPRSEEQHMLQLDGSTGEVDSSRGRGGRRRGRLKKLAGFVNNSIHKEKFLKGGGEVRGVGVKRKRGRPRKIQEKPTRIPEEEEGKNCDQAQASLGERGPVGEGLLNSEPSALTSPASLSPIMKPNGDGFQCNICSKSFGTVRAVNIHYNWKHAKDGRRRRSGSGQGSSFDQLARAARERELDELIEQLIPEVDDEVEEEVNTNFFIKEEEEEQDIKPHILDVKISAVETTAVKKEDELDPGFTCSICGKQFASEKSLKQHRTWKHSESGPFNCPNCADTFPSKTILNRHTRQKHSLKNENADETDPEDEEEELVKEEEDEELDDGGVEEKRVGCAQCSLSFAKLATLQRHYYWKHTELKDDSKFSVGGKFDESSWNAAVNKLIDRVPPGVFKCTKCQKEFPTKFNAQRHTDVHQNICYFCPLCSEERTFRTRQSLACHKMRLHAREISSEQLRCEKDSENEKSLEDRMEKMHEDGSRKGRNDGKQVAYNIAKKKLILKKMRAKAKHNAPSSSTSLDLDDDQSNDGFEELKVDRTRLSCDKCRRKFKNEVILEYHKVRCSSKWQEKSPLKPSEKWIGRKREKNVMIKRGIKEEKKEGTGDEDDIDLAFFSAKNLELVSEAELVGKLEADLGVYATQFEGEIDVTENGEEATMEGEQSFEVGEEEEEGGGEGVDTEETTPKKEIRTMKAKLKQEVTSDGPTGQSEKMINDDLHLADSDGSDHESSVMDLATVADNDDSDHELFNDNPDSLVDMALEDIAASQDLSNQMYNHGKDMKHAKRVAKKMKLKILTNKAEKAKLKQKVSELNLKLVTKEATISNLEKNCDTLTDKCNNGMMQLIEAKEENKNLSLRVLEQIKTIAKLEDGGQTTDLAGLKNENKELTKQIEESKATIEQLSQQLNAATKTSKTEGEKDSNEDKLKEELAEKDKLMQTYRTTHKELVDQLQQEMSKTKDLLKEKVKEVEESASAIANLTQEKKDLFEAVRKSSQMQSKVKALQKEIAELRAKESAATNIEKEDTSALVNGTLSTATQSSPVGGGAASTSPDLSGLSARDPRKRGRAGNQAESPQKAGLTLTLANFSALGARSANVVDNQARMATFLTPSLPMDMPTYNPEPVSNQVPKSQVAKELEYQEYIERFQFERLERHNQIQEKLARFKVSRDSIQAKIDSSSETELVKRELMKQLVEMKAQRDKDVIEFKMIESQHKDALDIFRKTHSIYAPPESEFTVEPFNFIPSPKYQPTGENIDENESLRETFSQSPPASDVEGSPVYEAPITPEYEAPGDSPSPPPQVRGALPRLTRSLSRESDDFVANKRESVNVLFNRRSSTESSSRRDAAEPSTSLDERLMGGKWVEDGSRERSNKSSRDGSRERSHRRSRESSPKVSREKSPRRSREGSLDRTRRRLKEMSTRRSRERSPRRSVDRVARRSLERSSRGYRERSPRRSRDLSPRRPNHRKSRERSPFEFSRSHFPIKAIRKKMEENELFRQKMKAREERGEEKGKQLNSRSLKQCNICNSDSHSQFFCPTARSMFKNYKEWKEFCQREEICLRCVRLKGYGAKRCCGKCDPFFCRKTQATVDVTCKDCPHDDSKQGESAGMHYRFCKCVFDQGKECGRRREDRTFERRQDSRSPSRSSSLQAS